MIGIVEPKRGDRGATSRRPTDDVDPLAPVREMIVPTVSSRIEEGDLLVSQRVGSSDAIGPQFVALVTAEPEILSLIRAAERSRQ